MTNLPLPFSANTYIQRRKILSSEITEGKILLIGNENSPRNFKDNYYKFRQDSTFLYYIGIANAKLIALIDVSTGKTTLFGNEISLDDIVWTGPMMSLQEKAEQSGIVSVEPLANLQDKLKGKIHFLPPYRAEHTLILSHLLDEQNQSPSATLRAAVIKQRNVKSEEELSFMEEAAVHTGNMHKAVMKACRPGLHEYDLVSVASKYVWNHQLEWAYSPILTTKGEILHNHNYSNQLDENMMVLYDGGIELSNGYCADITRTFPSSEKFTTLQKEMYSIVLAAYHKAVSIAGPGIAFKEVHLASAQTLVEGLIALGWMKGDPVEAVAAGAHTMFFQCGLGHMIGLDVHDMENLGEEYVGYEHPEDKSSDFGLKSLRLGRKLEQGYCVTIEPGIYIIPTLIDHFHSQGMYKDYINYDVLIKNKSFGGIRVEDNFVITEDGNRLLDGSLPVDIEGIEAMKANVMQHF